MSPTSTTELSFAVSFSCGSAAGLGLPLAAASAGGPSGKAVLNLPVRRSASGSDFPEGWKLFVVSSPDLVATAVSTSIELGEVFTSSATLSPSAGFTSNAPPNAYRSVSIWPVTTSSRLNAVRLSESTVGV